MPAFEIWLNKHEVMSEDDLMKPKDVIVARNMDEALCRFVDKYGMDDYVVELICHRRGDDTKMNYYECELVRKYECTSMSGLTKKDLM